MATKAEVEKRLTEKISAIPANFVAGIMTDPNFQKSMNKYMLKTHIVWGAYMAATIVGIWNIIAALNINPLLSGSISLLIGAVGLLTQWLPLREKRGSINESKDTIV